MESLTRSLNYELPQELHFDKYAQHILQNSRDDTATIALASTPTITSVETVTHHTTTSEFLKKLGASFIHSIQLQTFSNDQPEHIASSIHSASIPSISTSTSTNMDLDFTSANLMLDGQNINSAMDELQKQLEYDKFMNEVWIGVVLALVFISMIFCFCSCFLYHQFRMWKRNYRSTVTSSTDAEDCKINLDLDDPVPEYTLVSGLPSYDAALELLHKNPQSCLIVHPSVFEVFNKNERAIPALRPATEELTNSQAPTEAAVPLLPSSSSSCDNKIPSYIVGPLPSYNDAITAAGTGSSPTTPSLPYSPSLVSILTLTSQKSLLKNKSTPSTPSSEKPSKS